MKYFITTTLFLLPMMVFAEGYIPLIKVGFDPNTNFDVYINNLYALSVSIAALLAVIKIVIAGVKWMTTGIVTSKEEAKKDIQSSLFGLAIILGAVLIISVINKDILKVDLSMDKVKTPISSGLKDVLPYTLNPGDGEYFYTTESDCVTANPTYCPITNLNVVKCKAGEFYSNNGNPVCVVRK